MTENGTAHRLPQWALMYALHDEFRHHLDALLATRASPAAVRGRWVTFSDQLRFHHTAEDQVMWPPVRAKLAGDPDVLALLGAMEDEHRLIDPLLAPLTTLANGAGPGQPAAALARLRTTSIGHWCCLCPDAAEGWREHGATAGER